MTGALPIGLAGWTTSRSTGWIDALQVLRRTQALMWCDQRLACLTLQQYCRHQAEAGGCKSQVVATSAQGLVQVNTAYSSECVLAKLRQSIVLSSH